MKKILSILGFTQSASVVCANVTSAERLAEMSKEAKARMASWGRKTLLEGGEFSLKNTVLVVTNKP